MRVNDDNPNALPDPAADEFIARWGRLEARAQPGPTAAEWERIWQNVTAANAAAGSVQALGRRDAAIFSPAESKPREAVRSDKKPRLIIAPTRLRLVPRIALGLAAAMLFGVGLWLPREGARVIELAAGTEIDGIEAFEGFTPVVVSTGGAESIDLIWVLTES